MGVRLLYLIGAVILSLMSTGHALALPDLEPISISLSAEVVFDVPVDVTDQVRNSGTSSLTTDFEILLTSDFGSVLDTDAEPSVIKTLFFDFSNPLGVGVIAPVV